MKLKAAITDGAPDELIAAFGSLSFADSFLNIVENTFGVTDPGLRPAEFYVQAPDRTIAFHPEVFGVEVRLTGVSRGEREPEVFHDALKELERTVAEFIKDALVDAGLTATRIQMFVVIMVDGDVPGVPGSNFYGSVLESTPRWVTADGV
jgi:hypothetical protein